jgi:hypothetical protein
MKVCIKEWPNKTATIMTDNGEVIWTFSSVTAARKACNDWHSIYVDKDDCDDEPEQTTDAWCLA